MPSVTPQYVSHVSEDSIRYESVRQHLIEVAQMAAGFARPFGGEDWAYRAGLLHDIGKYSDAFQRRILHNGPRTDHSTAGAYELARNGDALLSYCVAGHHGGLPDGGIRGDQDSTLIARLTKAQQQRIPSYDAWKQEVEFPSTQLGAPPVMHEGMSEDELNFSGTFFTRMLYSCLVDADYLCTERFMRAAEREYPSVKSMAELRDMLEERLSSFYPPMNAINAVRCGVLDDCLKASPLDPGVFSLTVPTGGGKTYALMRFALNHAVAKGHDFTRVICAEPYTSIIEQNAEVYRKVFGEDQVLEHHSNYDFNDKDDSVEWQSNTKRLAAENWDRPLVVTTNVQFFESLFASKPSHCRKLHNIARSVIVLDEAQMIPTQFLEPCVRALCELVKHYGCTVVLCTATQPSLNKYFQEQGLEVREIASNPNNLVEQLRRVSYRSLGQVSDEELVNKILEDDQALCIVNSRKQARKLYDLVLEYGALNADAVFHLTTLMYPRHRSRVIDRIRRRVSDGLPCIVLATSLVEAGVDLDFGTVYRAIAGVDSMVQAAGRCNREMKRAVQDSCVYLFETNPAYAVPTEVRQCGSVAMSEIPDLLRAGELGSIDGLSTVGSYFAHLYAYRCLDNKHIVEQLAKLESSYGIASIPFARVAAAFKLVEDGASTVIIPTAQNERDVEAALCGEVTRAVIRRLSHYGVGVYDADRDSLRKAGAIEAIDENVFVLNDTSRYRDDVGLDLFVEGGEAVFL